MIGIKEKIIPLADQEIKNSTFPAWSSHIEPKFEHAGITFKNYLENHLSKEPLFNHDIIHKYQNSINHKEYHHQNSVMVKMKRPSTATKKHVKKISQEFNNMHTKFKNSNTTNFQTLLTDSQKLLLGGIGILSNCTKCQPSVNSVTPMISSPPVTKRVKLTEKQIYSASTLKRKGCVSAAKKILYLASPITSRVRIHDQRIEHNPYKRRISHSAKVGSGPKLPFEQVKRAKHFSEKAVMESKVFSIHGNFPAIREALVKRGWVEKELQKFPYVNPHPQNCVCTHIGWHINPILPHSVFHHHHSENSLGSENPSPKHQPATDMDTDSDKENENSQNEQESSVKENSEKIQSDTNANTDDIYEDDNKNSNSKNENKDCEEEILKNKNEDKDCEEEILKYKNENKDCVEEILKDKNENILDKNNEEDSQCSDPESGQDYDSSEDPKNCDKEHLDVCSKENNDSILNENNNITTDYFKKMTRTINTKMLGPSEIRDGLEKSINIKNISIFQYTIPEYVKKERKPTVKKDPEEKPPLEEEDLENNVSDNEEEEIDKPNEERFDTPYEPYNPYPELSYHITSADKPVVARVLRSVEPNLIWSWNKDSISFKHLSKDQLVNHFPNTPFTTKYGLCETLQQLHWFSEAEGVDTFVPRGFCIGHEDERAAFIQDYRTTACLNLLKKVTETAARSGQGVQEVAHPLGEVPIRRIRQALQHVEKFIESCCHDDIDSAPISPIRNTEWEAILLAHQKIIHQGRRIKAQVHHAETLLRDCISALERVEPYWPQLHMDGIRNVWIVKPGAQSRGRGIFLLHNIDEILSLVQSPMIYQTKYVVQKYMERPLLIHNTKFDIRQWFMVTDWNPLTIWMYRECYLRFCSRKYDLTNSDESIHLSNNAIQCKYMNLKKDEKLPEENMWDNYQFDEFLRTQGCGSAYDEIIYPGMKKALIATMLAAQVQIESFKYGFEFFGADFMLTEDFKPWLIEINSSPCMAATTNITRRMCYECLQDVVKVVVDYRQNKNADTGNFEMVYRDKEKSVPNPPYLGVNLQITGKQIYKSNSKIRKINGMRKSGKPIYKSVNALPLITLQLDDSDVL